jgi:AcrR family transcriptional regulator
MPSAADDFTTLDLPTQRLRIRRALIDLVAERGYGQTGLSAVLERAAIDRAAFERHYPQLQDCFVEIWEDYKRQFLSRTGEAFEAADSWRARMRAAAWAYCRFLLEDRDRARLFLVDFHDGGEAVQASRDVVIDRYADLIDAGNAERPPEIDVVPKAQAEAIVGASWEAALGRVRAGAFDELPEAIPQAMYFTVLPYLGAGAAEEELRRGPADIAAYQRGEH